MIALDDIRAVLTCDALVREVDQLRMGHVRVETTFKYPDGGSIELFVVADSREPLLPPRVLSDLGQTTAWLLDVQVKPWLSKKRRVFVDDVLRVHKVRQNGGALEIEFGSLDELEFKIVNLAQACSRVADLIFTRRSALQTSFNEELEEVLIDSDVEYEPNVELPGRFVPVRVDYLIRGKSHRSALMGWSSGNPAQAHVVGNEIFRKWYDLAVPARDVQRVTIFDDRYDVYRQEDMDRVRDHSDLVAFSERRQISDLVAA